MLGEESLAVLKKLCDSFGPAGFERETASIVKEEASKYADRVFTDKLGSVIFVKRGSSERPRVLVAGHIDEVGFVVSSIEEKTGFLTFDPIGGWFDQTLLSQRVVVRTKKGDLMGVIAAKPPHILTPEERDKVVKVNQMFIDIGVSSKEEAEKLGVRIGDPVIPWSPFTVVNRGKIAIGKAFDDRIGAFIALELIRRLKAEGVKHPNTVYGAATVQEEVGLRGASTVAHVVNPDVALIAEVDIAGDLPGVKPAVAPARLGRGPTIVTYDASMIPNQILKEFVISVAEEAGIPYQLSHAARGGTDAGRIHISRAGCPSLVIGVPTRHIHTHSSMVNLEDLANAIKLILETVKRLDSKTVEGFTSF